MKLFFDDRLACNDDDLVVPESAHLEVCILAYTASLDLAHPTLLSRDPVTERETAASLLHMYLDACRSLLYVYDSLTFGEPIQDFDDKAAPLADEKDDIPF